MGIYRLTSYHKDAHNGWQFKMRTKEQINPHWRCFFCDEVFITRGLAAEHFGTELACDSPIVACQIKEHEGHLVTYIRKLETELGVWTSESHEIQKSIVTLESNIDTQIKHAEDKGYAKGVADMKKQGFCVEPDKHDHP